MTWFRVVNYLLDAFAAIGSIVVMHKFACIIIELHQRLAPRGPLRLNTRFGIIFSLALGSACISTHAIADVYDNSGNNTTGFVTQYGTGSLVSNGTDIVGSNGGTWDTVPVTLTGNFQISFQVENNSFDGDSHLLLLNQGTESGIDVRNSPENTDTPSINIFSGSNFTNYYQFFFPTTAATLATAPSADFPNQVWTQIVVTRTGNVLTDDVGGQIIQADVSQYLNSTIQVGLGDYATTYKNSAGQLLYRDLAAVPEPSSFVLLGASLSLWLIEFTSKKRRNAVLKTRPQ